MRHTICIANLTDTSEGSNKCQARNKQGPVYYWNIYLSHERARGVNDFKARKTTKSCCLLYD